MTRTTKFEFVSTLTGHHEYVAQDLENRLRDFIDANAIVTSSSHKFVAENVVSVIVRAKVATIGEIQLLADEAVRKARLVAPTDLTFPVEAKRSDWPRPSRVDPETLFEMRAAFGDETDELVNALTGARTNIRTGRITYPDDYDERCEAFFGEDPS